MHSKNTDASDYQPEYLTWKKQPITGLKDQWNTKGERNSCDTG